MKKPFSTYRFTVLLALIISLLGAVCYFPLLQKKKGHTVTKQNNSQKNDHTTQELNIAQHILSTISFSLYPATGLSGEVFEYSYFGLPFEVVHKLHVALFRSSYLNNIFPFAISAQAP